MAGLAAPSAGSLTASSSQPRARPRGLRVPGLAHKACAQAPASPHRRPGLHRACAKHGLSKDGGHRSHLGHSLGNFSHTDIQLIFPGKAPRSSAAAGKLTADSIAHAFSSEASEEAKLRVGRHFPLSRRAFCDLHTC